MALSDGEILDIWSPGSSRPTLGKNKVIDFAHCIEDKVRKEYEALIQQMLEVLENFDDAGPIGEGWQSGELIALLKFARARLDGK